MALQFTPKATMHPKVRDLTGQEFGMLTVVSFAGVANDGQKDARAVWLVRCQCGTEKHVAGKDLVAKTKSCGPCAYGASARARWERRRVERGYYQVALGPSQALPSKVGDLTGRRFDGLVVMEFIDVIVGATWRGSRWRCRCDCGTNKVVVARHLCSGKSTSCGPCARRAGANRRWSRDDERDKARAAAAKQWSDPAQRELQRQRKLAASGKVQTDADRNRALMAAVRADARRRLEVKEARLAAIARRAAERQHAGG